jgi:hypothetical protein
MCPHIFEKKDNLGAPLIIKHFPILQNAQKSLVVYEISMLQTKQIRT